MDPDALLAYRVSKSTSVRRVHAVGLFARLSGAMDAECGEVVLVPLGVDWDPGMEHACPDCAAILAADRDAELAAKLARPAPRRRSGTPSLFAAAA